MALFFNWVGQDHDDRSIVASNFSPETNQEGLGVVTLDVLHKGGYPWIEYPALWALQQQLECLPHGW
jgi:hypothetical protein